ncbi:MAG: hypothetical protein RIT32_562 [Actinomycetota bacterium]|jgi:uncharacterized protein (TIGR03085 family)
MDTAKLSFSKSERSELAKLFKELGPDQPTLCEGWQTKQLLTHLILRERRPDAAAAIVIPAMGKWRDKVEAGLNTKPYAELVNLFATGPGKLTPFALPNVDNLANLFEFVIHHEDVRRAQSDWKARTDISQLQDEIGKRLPKFAILALRKLPLGVVMVSPAGVQTWLKRGNTVIELHGEPLEILLYISGRQKHAEVSIHGSPAAIATLERTKFGF